MGYRHREVRKDFSGGYNSRDGITHLQDSESPEMLNVMPGKRGGLAPRPGHTLVTEHPVSTMVMEGGISPPVTSVWEHVSPGGMRNFMAFAGRELRTLSFDNTWRTIAGDLAFNSRLEFTAHPIIQRSLFVNGADGYYSTDGRMAVRVPEYEPDVDELLEIGECVFPNAPRLIAFFANRVWLAGETGRRGRVYFNVDDILGNSLYNYFTAWSWIGIPTTRGEEVTAIIPYKDKLYVFTYTTMREIVLADPVIIGEYIPPAFAMNLISNTAGAISSRSIHVINDRMIFLGIDGVYMFDGTSNPYKISQRIEPDITEMDRNLWQYFCGTVWDRKYVISSARGD